jgi:alpha-glucosidase (family GH31 glycosyl hydrolase)
MKPLAYLYPADENTYHIWDEYVFGNAFLLAPLFTKDNLRTIYLPQGKWYDFNNQSIEYNGHMMFTQNVSIATTPVFIKGNSIFVTGQIYDSNSRIWKKNLNEDKIIVIHLYPGEINEQATFNYVDYFDNDKEKIMVLEHQATKIVFTSESLGTTSTIELKCAMKPVKILFNKMPVEFKYDKTKNIASVQIEKNRFVDLQMFYSP